MPRSSSVGLDAAIESISQAIQEATDNCEATRGRRFQTVTFSAAWVGIAGYDRPALASRLDAALSGLLRLPLGRGLKVTADIDLLPTAVAANQGLDSVVVVVAGTGSVAMSYARDAGGPLRRTNRAGGWGHLLGDDGGGYGIGREALRSALLAADLHRARGAPLPPLPAAVFRHFGARQHPPAGDLLSAVLVPDPAPHQAGAATTTRRIASVARAVLALAAAPGGDEDARRIAEGGTASLARLVALLVEAQGLAPARCGLVLAGGLLQDGPYRLGLVEAVERQLGAFGQVEVVGQPAVDGARSLLGL